MPETQRRSTHKGQKLKALQHLLPEGLVVTSRWLEDAGYSSALRSKYVANGWLEQPARGIFKRPGAETQWQHLVVSLQYLMGFPVVVGGLNALELRGYGHYIPMVKLQKIQLFAESPLPKWLNNFDPTLKFRVRNANKLFKSDAISRAIQDLPPLASTGKIETVSNPGGGLRLHAWGDRDWPMLISRPERAILEMLDEIPAHQSFQHINDIFTGLTDLSPRILQELLEGCGSVKVNRLFLWFAERSNHAWFKRLNPDSIYTGRGKRVIEKGGRLDQKYQITVPEDNYDY